MEVILKNTEKVVELNGVPARIWVGKTSSGIEVQAYITRIAIDKGETRIEEFENELMKCSAPVPDEMIAIPLRYIL